MRELRKKLNEEIKANDKNSNIKSIGGYHLYM